MSANLTAGHNGANTPIRRTAPPDWHEEPRSYFVILLSPADAPFRFETDTIEPDDEGNERRVRGEGRIGCVVAISLVAPFAIVTLDEMEVFESGSRSEPDVEPHIFGLDGKKLKPEEHYREILDDEDLELLRKLRARIVRVLNDFAITVIPEDDLDQPVPWLRADEEILVGHAGEPVTIRNAFFFSGDMIARRFGRLGCRRAVPVG